MFDGYEYMDRRALIEACGHKDAELAKYLCIIASLNARVERLTLQLERTSGRR